MSTTNSAQQYEFFFDAILKCPAPLALFKAYVATELNTDNLDFVMAVHKFEQQPLQHDAKLLFGTYLAVDSMRELNINHIIRNQISTSIETNQLQHAFDPAYVVVYESLKCGCFARFKRTKVWYDFVNKCDKQELLQFGTSKVNINFVSLKLCDFALPIISDKDLALARLLLEDYYHWQLVQSSRATSYSTYVSECNFFDADTVSTYGYMSPVRGVFQGISICHLYILTCRY